jgi:hypothetical protein
MGRMYSDYTASRTRIQYSHGHNCENIENIKFETLLLPCSSNVLRPEDFFLPGYNAVHSTEIQPTFRRNISSSGFKRRKLNTLDI